MAEGAGADSSRELGDELAHMRVRVLHVESILRVAILRDSGATMFPLVIAASCPAGSMYHVHGLDHMMPLYLTFHV